MLQPDTESLNEVRSHVYNQINVTKTLFDLTQDKSISPAKTPADNTHNDPISIQINNAARKLITRPVSA